MTTLRALGVVVAAILLATPAVAAAPGTADDLQTRTVHRAYGDGPVTLGKADVLKIRFSGGAGNRVRLAGVGRCPLSLRGPAGEKVAKLPEGFWQLTDRGVQTFTLTRCAGLDDDAELQLQKLRVSRAVTDGPGLRLRAKRGYVDALRVRVPASGRLKVAAHDQSDDASLGFEGALLPNGTWFLLGGYAQTGKYYFEAGRKISGEFGPLSGAGGGGALRMEAADHLLLVMAGSGTVWQSVAEKVAMSVDAPATTLPPSEVPYRDYELDFEGQAGSWVHAEIDGPVAAPYAWPWLLGPNGHQFDLSWYWRLPATGTYRLMLPTAPTSQPTVVRIRSIVQVDTPVPTDGTHVTLTASEPGRWVVAPLTLPAASYQLTAHSAVTNGAWVATATVAHELNCDRFSMGCGEFSAGSVSPDKATSGPFGGYGPDWAVLLQPYPGVTASVELSVQPAS